jgi:hypothetical protein
MAGVPLNTWTTPTCPDDCADVLLLPAIAAAQDCGIAPKLSQIVWLYLTPSGATVPFTHSGGTASAVSGAIDNTLGDNTKSLAIYGKGGIAEHEPITYEAPGGATLTVYRDYTMTFRVVPTEAALYTLLRYLQCGNVNYTFWYGNLADQLFGDTGGIKVKDINVQMPQGEGATDFQEAQIIITYRTSNGDPLRFTNPL